MAYTLTSVVLTHTESSVLFTADLERDGVVVRKLSTSLEVANEASDYVDAVTDYVERIIEHDVAVDEAITDAALQLEGMGF